MGSRGMMLFVAAIFAVWTITAANEHGYLKCAVSNKTVSFEQNITQDCGSINPGELHSSSAPPFCFVLFKNNSETSNHEVYMSGCWVGGENECLQAAHTSENNGACYFRKNAATVLLFCCCIDEMCNRDFKPLPPNDPPEILLKDEKLNHLLDDQKSPNPFSGVLRYIIAPLLALTVIAFLTWMGYRKHRKNNLPQNQFGYDNQFEKSPSEVSAPMLPLKSVTLMQLAAQGRFGAVWRGIHHDTPVAVKIFPAGERQSWEKELEVYQLPQMQHANILRFIGTGQQTNAQSGLMEYWLLTSWHSLGSLYDYLRFNKISYSQLLHLSDSIAKGMLHLHTEAAANKYERYKPPVAHRDIKSKNIILKDDRTACLADFGLAIVFELGENIGETHGQVGTRRYMAPEVLEGAISFDQEAFQRIDMYAVSLVMWEMLTRTMEFDPFPEYRLPFEDQVGQHPSLEDMQETVVNRKQRPSIRDSWRDESKLEVFVSTLEDCWDADPDARLNACTVHQRLQFLLANQWAAEIVDSERSALLPPTETVVNTHIV